jgi:hypothetical protein
MIINSTFILFGASYTQDLLINSTSHSHLINQSTYKVLGVSHKTINLHGDYLEHEVDFFIVFMIRVLKSGYGFASIHLTILWIPICQTTGNATLKLIKDL